MCRLNQRSPELPDKLMEHNAQTFSEAILSAMNRGLTLRAAVDEVLGAGTYQKLITGIYRALRERSTCALPPD